MYRVSGLTPGRVLAITSGGVTALAEGSVKQCSVKLVVRGRPAVRVSPQPFQVASAREPREWPASVFDHLRPELACQPVRSVEFCRAEVGSHNDCPLAEPHAGRLMQTDQLQDCGVLWTGIGCQPADVASGSHQRPARDHILQHRACIGIGRDVRVQIVHQQPFCGCQLVPRTARRAHRAPPCTAGHYKCPTSVEFEGGLALTATGKVQKEQFELRAPVLAGSPALVN